MNGALDADEYCCMLKKRTRPAEEREVCESTRLRPCKVVNSFHLQR